MWFVLPIFQLIKYVCIGTPLEQPNRIWFVSALAITVAFFGAVLFLVPAPTVMTAPCVVDFKPHKVVRSGSSGFANEIHVENGQYVSKGDLLVTLENPQLQAEYQALIIDIRISKLRINSLLNAEEIALLQLERENLQALDNRRLELESLLGQLDVVSISDGLVLGLELFDKLGTYVRPGDELLSIGDPEQLQVIAMADQDDVQWLEKRKMDNVKLLIWGRSNDSLIDGQMVSMEPRVRDDLPHPAFAAANGGPLSVVPRQEVGDDGGVVADDDQWVLVEPKVAIQIGLGDSEKSELLAGQLGVMMVHGRDENLGSYLANQIIRFVRHNNLRTHGL
jgi:putative peptide zinc metalloprotease protein